jgi:hypothetical protein
MSTEAFGSRRVTESLKAIAKYLDDGAQVAGGVAPAQVIRLDLDPVARTPGPRLTFVFPRVVKFTAGESTDFDLSVAGSDLGTVQVFKLVRGEDELAASTLSAITATSFTAEFEDIVDPLPGTYDAFVVNDSGQTYLLDDACRLKVRESQGPPAPITQAPSLKLGGLVPNSTDRGDTTVGAFLVVLNGTPSEVYIADISNNRLPDWHVEKDVKESDWKAVKAIKQQYQDVYKGKATTVLLNITVPHVSSAPGVFYLVAKSAAPVSEDRLVFSVLTSSSAGSQ